MSDEQDELRKIFGAAPRFSAEFDQRVLAEAKRVMRRVRIKRMAVRWGAGLAAAAVITLAVSVPWHGSNHGGRVAVGVAPKPGAKVNILVAYRLARALHTGETVAADWDKTGDGKVDQNDVDAWAADAVKIDPGGTQ